MELLKPLPFIGLIVLFVFTSFSGFGQRFEIGPKLASTFNDSRGPGTSDMVSSPAYGISLGGYATYFVFAKVRIRAELLISSRGFKSQSISFGIGNTGFAASPSLSPSAPKPSISGLTAYSLNKRTLYLDVPVGVDYAIIPRINLQTGCIISIFIREYKNELSNRYTVNLQHPDDVKYYQQLQASLYGGASYGFDFGLHAGVRGTLGITNTFLASSTRADSQIMPYSFHIFVTYPLYRF